MARQKAAEVKAVEAAAEVKADADQDEAERAERIRRANAKRYRTLAQPPARPDLAAEQIAERDGAWERG